MPSDREFDGEFCGIDEFGPTSQIRAKIAKDRSENLSFDFQVLVQPGEYLLVIGGNCGWGRGLGGLDGGDNSSSSSNQ